MAAALKESDEAPPRSGPSLVVQLGLLVGVAKDLDEDEQWHEQMLEPPTVLGLTRFEAGQAIYAVVVKCPGNKQWALEREVRTRAVSALQAAGIKAILPTLA